MAAAQQARDRGAERRRAVEALATLALEPRALLQAAVDLIKAHTAVSGAYAALVAEPEEPDWVVPEDDEAAAVESDDEADPGASQPADGEGAAEGAAAEDAPAAGGEDGLGEPVAPKIPKPVDCSRKYLAYAVATAGQEFVPDVDLFRPAPLADDADEGAKPEPVPYTFRVLDERLPMVYLPSVSGEERVRFFRRFPKIGAYQACGVQVAGGEFKAVIAADTLFPEAGGQPLSVEDQDLIWEVSRSVGKALEAVSKGAAARIAAASAAEAMAALHARLAELRPAPAEAAVPPAEGGWTCGWAPACA